MYKIAHVDATSVVDAQAQLAKGKAMAMAGGTDLVTYLKGMITPNAPTTVVNLKTIPNLAYIKEEGGMLKIGALATLTAIANSATVKGNYAALAQSALAVGAPELRNMGTIGGNICQRPRCLYFRNEYNSFNCLRKNSSGLCYALLGENTYHSIFGAVGGCVAVCPSDTAVALVAFGASIVTNKKTWKAADFFAPTGEQINAIAADEIVTEVQVPTPAAGTKSTYLKFAFRKAIDFPLVSVAVVTGANPAVVLGGVAGAPRVATAAQDAIKGKAIDATSAAAAGDASITGAVALTKNKYKLQIAKTLVKRALLSVK